MTKEFEEDGAVLSEEKTKSWRWQELLRRNRR